MPTLSSMRIPPPKSWEEFEQITQSALRIKWDSPNLQRHGRQGQSQAGVDIYGEDNLGRFVGIQCKNVKSELRISTASEELSKAEQFEPPLSAFYIATTLSNDVVLQREVRLLSVERIKTETFPIGVFFWEDIIQELIKNPQDFNKHYPDIKLNTQDPRISGPQLLCNLDIAFFGLQIQEYIQLIFGEIGVMAGEDPIQIRGLGSTIKNCASVLLANEEADDMNQKVDNLVSLALKDCTNEESSKSRWSDVNKLSTLIIQDISDLEYRLTGVFLAAFRLGVILGKWNTIVEAYAKLPEDDNETIIDLFSALNASEQTKVKVGEALVEYNSSEKISKIHIPNRIYNYARRLILNWEISA